MKVLITGFTPFNNESINPSYEAVKLLPFVIDDKTIYKMEVDTSFHKSFIEVKNEIDRINPDYVLLIGQAGLRKNVSIEKVVINYIDSTIPDNDKELIENKKIISYGPDAYFSTLDLKRIKEYVDKKGHTLSISYSAGTFVCNYLFYMTLDYLKDKNTKTAFIHVPYIKEQVKSSDIPYMELDDIKDVLINIIESL